MMATCEFVGMDHRVEAQQIMRYASNTSHPSRLPAFQTRVLNPFMASLSSDVQMQLKPTEISASNSI